jgi:predicted hydrolase (HD superfamily)
VLVAMVITGLVVTVFFQLLSAGIRLEYRSIQRTKDVLNVGQAFAKVLSEDVRQTDFEWRKEDKGNVRILRIEPVETLKTHMESEQPIKLTSELYRYVFEYTNEDKRRWTIVRYVQHDPDFFSEDFKSTHFP